MKIKTRSILTAFLFTLLITILALLIVVVLKGTATASAATTLKYQVAYSYTYSFTEIKGSQKTTKTDSGKDVYSTSVISGSNNTKSTIMVVMYGSGYSGTGTFQNNGYINSDVINIEVLSANIQMNIKVTNNKNNALIASGRRAITARNVSDGNYTVTMTSSNGWTVGTTGNEKYEFSGTFSFRVDATLPTITGASTLETEVLTNEAIDVKPSDNESGIKALYMKTPNSKTFRTIISNYIKIDKGSENGLYTFYATDKALNRSEYYYVFFDDTPPELICTGAEFGSTTKKEFTVSCSDNSGVAELYYKTNNSDWINCGTEFVVDGNTAENTYFFYSIDPCGNKTDEVWIGVGEEIFGKFVKAETDNSAYFTWGNSDWSATLNGKGYTDGAWIKEEGEHIIRLSSDNKTAVYSYIIDHYYEEKLSESTCTSSGYIQYTCKQCGDTYVAELMDEKGHYYVASTKVASCTEGGFTLYTCTRCGDNYTDNFTNPLGHNYEAIHQPSTCTDCGKTVFTCQVCGSDYYEVDGSYPTGHSYVITITKEPTCTEDGIRINTCDKCDDTYETVISANGHNYGIAEIQTSKGKTTRVYTCLACGNSYKQELGNQYEEVSNYVEYLFNQYSSYMWWVLIASAGIWSIVIGVMFAVAQKNEDKEKSKKMIVNYVIGLVVIAVIVVACPFLIRGIASLIV